MNYDRSIGICSAWHEEEEARAVSRRDAVVHRASGVPRAPAAVNPDPIGRPSVPASSPTRLWSSGRRAIAVGPGGVRSRAAQLRDPRNDSRDRNPRWHRGPGHCDRRWELAIWTPVGGRAAGMLRLRLLDATACGLWPLRQGTAQREAGRPSSPHPGRYADCGAWRCRAE